MNPHSDKVGGHTRARLPAWTGTRVARTARDLARSAAYYRDLLGLHPRGGFEMHGYDGMFIGSGKHSWTPTGIGS